MAAELEWLTSTMMKHVQARTREAFHAVARNVNWYSQFRKQYGSSLRNYTCTYCMIQKSCQEHTQRKRDWLLPPALKCLPQCFDDGEELEWLTCPSADERVENTYREVMEILLTHKKDEILPFATPWMELVVTALSIINQAQNVKYHVIFFIDGI